MERYKDIPFGTIVEVYRKKLGNMSATAEALKINRNTLAGWRAEFDELREMMADVDESLIDFSETKLIEQINEGNLTAIIFHLKTKGKRRGWVERTEITGDDGEAIPLRHLTQEEIDFLREQ